MGDTTPPKTPQDAGCQTSLVPAQTTPPEDGLTQVMVTTPPKTPLDAGCQTSLEPAQTTPPEDGLNLEMDTTPPKTPLDAGCQTLPELAQTTPPVDGLLPELDTPTNAQVDATKPPPPTAEQCVCKNLRFLKFNYLSFILN